MTDREMLEIAARAAGYTAMYMETLQGSYCIIKELDSCRWNPLQFNGDTLRLAIDCEISIIFDTCMDDAPIVTARYFGGEVTNCNFPDSGKATRRTIVQAVVNQQLQLEEARGL